MQYTLVIQEAEEGGFVGFVPEVPGANTQGETQAEVRENIREAIEMVLSARAEMALNDLKSKGQESLIEQIEL